jgi:SAM-dependent methyltransferase
MLTREFLKSLHCPYCGAPLCLESDGTAQDNAERVRWGIVRCACYRYPILDGILILRQFSSTVEVANPIVERLAAGDRAGALDYALSATAPVPLPRSALQRTLNRLARYGLKIELPRRENNFRRAIADNAISFRNALTTLRPNHYADYLFYRHANPSFLASIPLLSVIGRLKTGTVLDLACGIGHSAFLIHKLFPHLQVVAADHDIVNLYLAQRFIAPDVTYICLDTEFPLPFADEVFAGVWCLDGMHYIRSKAALGREFKRVSQQDGLWIIPHLHNVLVENINCGIALAPDDYRRCFAPLAPRLFDEMDILGDFSHGRPLDLTQQMSEQEQRQVQAVSLVGASAADIWTQHDGLVDRLIGAGGLQINPIFQKVRAGTKLLLRAAWPSSGLEAECAPVRSVMPMDVEIEPGLLSRLRDEQLSSADYQQVEALIRSFVLVSLPDSYQHYENGESVGVLM